LGFSVTIENELKLASLVDFRLEASPTEFKLSHAPIGRYLLLTMRVLAIDASLRNCGVAIIEVSGGKFKTLYFGVIHNASSLRMSSCLVAIRDRLAELIHTYEPDCCALESVIYVQSYKTAITLGAARGSAIMAAT